MSKLCEAASWIAWPWTLPNGVEYERPFSVGRGLPLATRMESRIGVRRRPPPMGIAGGYSCCGNGRDITMSSIPEAEWLKNESAVSQM